MVLTQLTRVNSRNGHSNWKIVAVYCLCRHSSSSHPSSTSLPLGLLRQITIDYGTNNEENLKDPLYLGLRQKRVSNQEAKEFMEEFMLAVKKRWPDMLVQFEDFNTELAFDLLDTWRDRHTCFNDDVHTKKPQPMLIPRSKALHL